MQNFIVEKYVRPNILALQPYMSARDEFTGEAGIFLDANENPFGELNRYPDPGQVVLKEKLGELKGIPAGNIFIGNGSDEVIDLAMRIFCEPGKDSIIICPPTYGMYEVSARINDIAVLKIPLVENFKLDSKNILRQDAKILFICSPNNPTGNSFEDIEDLLKNFDGIVFADEAYIDFSTRASLLEKLHEYPNLIISQTFSKAWALAAARVGIAYASEEIISLFKKVKPPYNVSEINQAAALNALHNRETTEAHIELILSQRNWLENELLKISCVRNVYPSDANFLLVEMLNADDIYSTLVEKKIITRNRNSVVKNCIRITVGAPEENKRLIYELRHIAQ